MMNGTKSLFQSKGVWGGLIAAGAGIGQLFGYGISAADARELTELVQGLVASIGGILAVYGRIKATQKIA